MALNTPHNVTLTEGQIGIILCSLEKYFKGVKDTKEELLYLHNCTGAHKFDNGFLSWCCFVLSHQSASRLNVI